jgi:hypothetical protein
MITQRNEIEDDNLKYLNFHLRRDYKRGYNIFLIREMILFTKVYSLFIGLRSEKQTSGSKWQKLKRQQLKRLSH